MMKNRDDKWALDVKGRLSGIIDLVAEKVLMHKKCNTNFLQGSGNNAEGKSGRKVDEGRRKLFEKLCVLLDEKMEHNVMTLEEIHKKMIDLDESDDKSQTYTKNT